MIKNYLFDAFPLLCWLQRNARRWFKCNLSPFLEIGDVPGTMPLAYNPSAFSNDLLPP
jgi:hypothetical protein